MVKSGISCEIYVNRPPNGAFLPGMPVSGFVRYNASEDTKFDKMVVVLKGIGRLSLSKIEGISKKAEKTYYNQEDYVNIENIEETTNVKYMPTGLHLKPFNFMLPKQIPSSLSFTEVRGLYKVHCNIVYYIGVHFEKSEDICKVFNEPIKLLAKITPTLPIEPVVYVSSKKLFQVFNLNEKQINIKGTLSKSVVNKAGKVIVAYEISNNSNVTIKTVETKIIAVYTFTTKTHWGVKIKSDIKGTSGKTGRIDSDHIFSTTLEMVLPEELYSVDNSKFVIRDYAIVIEAHLPLPYNSAILEIPIQVDNTDTTYNESIDPPSSYTESIDACDDKIRNDVVYFNCGAN